MVLSGKIDLKDLIQNGNCFFPDMIKFCVDIERNRMLGGYGRLITDEKTLSVLSDILYDWVFF